MGLFSKIFSHFAQNTYRGICRVMIKSYAIVKHKNPTLPPMELYAQVLALRPTWKREGESFFFTRGRDRLEIKAIDKFNDVVRNIIILETMPAFSSYNQDYTITTLKEIVSVITEEFKNFAE